MDLSSFWRLQNLGHLGLSNNNLSVIDMDGEGNNSLSTYLPRVTRLELAGCNLIGFPSSLAHLNQMSYLDLSCNRISGAIPKWIWVTWNSSLAYLNLSHNMFSIIQLTSYILPFIGCKFLISDSISFRGRFQCQAHQRLCCIIQTTVSLHWFQTSLCILAMSSEFLKTKLVDIYLTQFVTQVSVSSTYHLITLVGGYLHV